LRKIILTTEKDAVRLLKFGTELSDLPIYVLPIKQQFLFGEGVEFEKTIIGFIENFNSAA
jgi:tetraacyldisaccharide 4'-kinase